MGWWHKVVKRVGWWHEVVREGKVELGRGEMTSDILIPTNTVLPNNLTDPP